MRLRAAATVKVLTAARRRSAYSAGSTASTRERRCNSTSAFLLAETMAATPKLVRKQPAAPELRSEQIVISSDESPTPTTTSRTILERLTLRNAMRRTSVELTLYREGFLDVATAGSGNDGERYHLDLHYLDPIPTIERSVASGWFYTALSCFAAAGLAAFALRFESVWLAALVVLGVAVVAAAAAVFVGLYRSCERTAFATIHGRAPVLQLVANLGSLKKFRAFVPVLSAAIEEAAERIGDDTAAFLRAEMREHYRLRGDGVLSNQSCADSTGRILAQFDVRL